MKRIFAIILIALSGATAVVSCTEEVVTPTEDTNPTPPPPTGGKI